MDMVQAYSNMKQLEKLYDKWNQQGLSEEQKKTRLNLFLDEKKRQHLSQNN